MGTSKVAGIVLAAGEGKRMKSATAKVLHAVAGMPMIDHVLYTLAGAGVARTVVVTGHMEDQVRAHLAGRAEMVTQAERLGTGHAVMQAEPLMRDFDGMILIAYGDAPLWRTETIQEALARMEAPGIGGIVLTTLLDDPTGYGRIIRDSEGHVKRIIEHKDASEEERWIREINSGTYCFPAKLLFGALREVKNDNAQSEYYLTDVIDILIRGGHRVEAFIVPDKDEAMGVNSRAELALAEAALQRRTARRLMDAGVTIVDPASAWIDVRAQIGKDTIIYPGTILRGPCVIGEGCKLGPNSELIDAKVGDGATVMHSYVKGGEVKAGDTVGPFGPKSR